MKQIITFFILIISVCSFTLKADALPEYTIKAAYLYNFALLTDWPENKKSGNFNLCLHGKDSFGSAIDALEGKMIGNQIIKIQTLKDAENVKKCHIVFLGEADHHKEKQILEEIAGSPVLIVTDDAKKADYHILIVQDSEKLAFTINMKALKESNLSLSSRLLNLAKQVTP